MILSFAAPSLPVRSKHPVSVLLGLVLNLTLLIAVGCGGGGGTSASSGGSGSSGSGSGSGGATSGDFSIALQPSSITLVPGGSQTVSVTVTPTSGFTGTIQITGSNLPAGITVTPASVNLSTGSVTAGLQINAAAGVAATNVSLTVQCQSGSTTHSTPLAINSSTPALPAHAFVTLGGGLVRGYNDQQRHLLFVSNLYLDEVDVVSTLDFSIQKRIPAAQPVGLDQMADGKTIVVGTMTSGIYMIDEDSLTATVDYLALPSGLFIAPIIPVAMANGKVFLLFKTVEADSVGYIWEGAPYEWTPGSSTVTPVPIPNQTGVNPAEHIARSADHKFAIFDEYDSYLALYSSDNDSFTLVNNVNLFAGDVAVNADGSQFALSINGAVNFYDRSLNLLGSVALPMNAGNQELAEFYGMQYSPDSTHVYIQATDLTLSPIVSIDAQHLTLDGMVGAYFENAANPAYLIASGGDNSAFVITEGGVGVADCSHPASNLQIYPVVTGLTPDAAPLNASASAVSYSYDIPAGTSATVGGTPTSVASNADGQAVVTIPPSTVAGPADLVFLFADGTSYVQPQAFSYGLTAATLGNTLVPDQTPVSVLLSGFGLNSDNQQPTAPSVTFGGKAATAVAGSFYGVQGIALDSFEFTSPTATSGTVDVNVSNANGQATLTSALTYVHTVVIPSDPGLSELIYDTHRNLVYATRTNGTQIFVFDPNSLQWKAPLAVPGAATGANYNYFALTPDGTKLLAVDTQNAVLAVFSPDNPAGGQSVSLRNSNLANGPPPGQLPFESITYVATMGNSRALVYTGWAPLEVDLTNLTMQYRTGLTFYNVFRNSLDGTQLTVGAAGISGGGIGYWNPSTDAITLGSYGSLTDDFAISNDGTKMAAVKIDQLGTDDASFLIDDQMHLFGQPQYPDLALPQSRIVEGIVGHPAETGQRAKV